MMSAASDCNQVNFVIFCHFPAEDSICALEDYQHAQVIVSCDWDSDQPVISHFE